MAQMNEALTLIYEKPAGYDADGFPTEAVTLTRRIYCQVKSVKSTEYYDAMRDGIKASMIFAVYPHEFYCAETDPETGETISHVPNKLQYGTTFYKVVRPYQKGHKSLELTCEEVE